MHPRPVGNSARWHWHFCQMSHQLMAHSCCVIPCHACLLVLESQSSVQRMFNSVQVSHSVQGRQACFSHPPKLPSQ